MKSYIYERHLEECTVIFLQFPDNVEEISPYFVQIESIEDEIKFYKERFGFDFVEDMTGAPKGCVRQFCGWL